MSILSTLQQKEKKKKKSNWRDYRNP